RRHTRLQGDWSSDVCSSDLTLTPMLASRWLRHTEGRPRRFARLAVLGERWDRGFERVSAFFARAVRATLRVRWIVLLGSAIMVRSEERRVGEEGGGCRGGHE